MELNSTIVNQVNVLEIAGSFDIYTADVVRAWIEDTTDNPPVLIVIDLAQVEFIDSTALATLVQGLKRAREKSGDIFLSSLRTPVRMVLEMTRLDKVFEIYITKEDAISAIQAVSG